jgi:hypothetical protein
MFLLLFATLALPPAPPAQSTVPAHTFYGPAFELAATPTRPRLEQGGSTAVTLRITSATPAEFRLSYAGIPASVIANTATAGPGVHTVIFRCPPDTPPGVYAIQITAAAGDNQQTLTFPFVVHPKGDLGPR